MKAGKTINIMFILIGVVAAIIPMQGFAQGATMDHSDHVGERIHASTVEGYKLAYHILDLPGKTERHLMVYIQDPSGNTISTGKVGYLINGPDGNTQKIMAMAMKESFGGDVNLMTKGDYNIRVKAIVGEKKLMDTFTYQTQ